MYVNILHFSVDNKNGISSNELSMFEDNLYSKPFGLDRFHIFKDKHKDNNFYLIEYWNSKDAMSSMEKSGKYNNLNKIHQISTKNRYKKIECDVII